MSEIKKIHTFLRSNDWLRDEYTQVPGLTKREMGWGNGYCALPPEHPCYGMKYGDIYHTYTYGWPSELTFSDKLPFNWSLDFKRDTGLSDDNYWLIGFDTMHFMDTLERWPKERVQEAADQMAYNFLEIWIKKERDEKDNVL